MTAMDADLLRMALDYVDRQCSYMGAAPTEKDKKKAAREVYRVLKELRDAQRRHARAIGQEGAK